DRLAYGYRWEDETWKLEPALPDGAFGAMGGMLTSVSDLAKYVGAFLAAFPPRDGVESGPVRRASLREMQQIWRSRASVVTRTAAGGPNLNSGGYGYGLRVSQSFLTAHFALPADEQGEVGGEVVHRQAGARREADLVRQRQDLVGGRGD